MGRFSIALLPFLLFTAVLAVADSGGAQSPGTQPRTRLRAMAPLQLENQWTTALINRDARTFDQLLASNFVYTENNEVMSRGDVIKSVNGSDRVTWARNEGMKLHDFGDVQVITGVLHLKGTGNKGAAFDKRYRFTDTWQKQSGRWRIIAAQDYLIP
jgi:ketosteroid isomerase-like protein